MQGCVWSDTRLEESLVELFVSCFGNTQNIQRKVKGQNWGLLQGARAFFCVLLALEPPFVSSPWHLHCVVTVLCKEATCLFSSRRAFALEKTHELTCGMRLPPLPFHQDDFVWHPCPFGAVKPAPQEPLAGGTAQGEVLQK